MSMSETADLIIVYGFIGFAVQQAMRVLAVVVEVVEEKRRRRAMRKLSDRFSAARRAAREAAEAKLKAEGRWDDYEVQDAMDAAGRAVDPRNLLRRR